MRVVCTGKAEAGELQLPDCQALGDALSLRPSPSPGLMRWSVASSVPQVRLRPRLRDLPKSDTAGGRHWLLNQVCLAPQPTLSRNCTPAQLTPTPPLQGPSPISAGLRARQAQTSEWLSTPPPASPRDPRVPGSVLWSLSPLPNF